MGICQGNCLSAVLFIYYLAKSTLKNKRPFEPAFTIEPKYADDITWATTSENVIKTVKDSIPSKLRTRNLIINEDKTEEFMITNKEQEWKDCKLLGSKLDTIKDLERRKCLTIDAMKELKSLFKNHRINEKLKIRTFEAYVSSIFLYNSELWAVTKTIAKSIDGFHRRQLRYALNIQWPNKISNDEVYKRTKAIPWSETIRKRRLSWLGHLMRLPKETPAQIALTEALKPSQKYRGRPRATWLEVIKKDLNELNIVSFDISANNEKFIKCLYEFTENRMTWNKTVRSAISAIGGCETDDD